MKKSQVHEIAENLVEQNYTNEQIRKELFNIKGIKTQQIRNVMDILDCDDRANR